MRAVYVVCLFGFYEDKFTVNKEHPRERISFKRVGIKFFETRNFDPGKKFLKIYLPKRFCQRFFSEILNKLNNFTFL